MVLTDINTLRTCKDIAGLTVSIGAGFCSWRWIFQKISKHKPESNLICIVCLHNSCPQTPISHRKLYKYTAKYMKKICGELFFSSRRSFTERLWQFWYILWVTFLQSIFQWLLPTIWKIDFTPCLNAYIFAFGHVKGNWNIAIERKSVVIRKLEWKKSLLLKLYEARRVSWLKWNEKEIFLYCHKEMFLGKNENLWRWSAFVNIPDRNQRHVMIQMLRHALCRWN